MAGKNTVQRVEEIVAPFAAELSVSLWDITFTKEEHRCRLPAKLFSDR